MNLEDQQAASAAPPAPELNIFQRAMMAFMSPTSLGEYLRIRQPWFWNLAIIGIASMILFFLVPAEVFEAAVAEGMRGRSQDQQMDPATAIQFARIAGIVFALLGTFIGAWIISGVVYLAFNIMAGSDSTYKQHLSAVSHMYWINLLGFVVLVPLWIAKQDMNMKLGLGLLLPESPTTFVGHLMNGINLFGLWGVAALGAIESGLSGGKITVGKGIVTVFTLYLIWAVIAAAWATMMR
jgi:hypothetical protein